MEINQQNNLKQENQSEEQSFNLSLFLLECLSNWKWFVLSLVVVLSLSVFFIMRQIPTYRVDSMILVIDKWTKSNSDVLSQSLGIESGANDVATEIEIMRSRKILHKVVNDLDLYVSYQSKGGMRNTPLYRNTPFVVKPDSTTDVNQLNTSIGMTITTPDKEGNHNITAKYTLPGTDEEKEVEIVTATFPDTIFLPMAGTFIIEKAAGYEPIESDLLISIRNPMNVARFTIAPNLTLNQHQKLTLLIAASYETPIPQMGIDIINRIVYYYNEEGIAEKNLSATNTENFINERLVAIQKELSSVEEEVERYRTKRGLTDLSSEAQMYLEKTGATDIERSKLDVQLSLIEYIENFISDPANTYSPIPALKIEKAELSSIINEYNKIIAERERQLNTSSENNPVIKVLSQNIVAQKAIVLQAIASTRKSIELSQKDLDRTEEEAELKIRNMPQYERELTDIMRQQRIKENLFVFLLEKREENALTQTLAVGDARIIDPPVATSNPVSPQKPKILFVAFILALLIPGGIIFLKRIMFPSFHDKAELEELTQIPILTEVPHCGEDDFFVVKEKKNDSKSELFRLLRNNTQFVLASPDKKVVMVTSSVSKEGKTFVSCNLAVSFALTGKKTIIVGLDIRRPMAALHFNVGNKSGIVNYLSGQETSIDNIIKPTSFENLDILPGGPVPPNPNELLLRPQLDELFAELRKRYDYIIVDSAPVGMVSDSFLINRVVDMNIFVTRAKYTSRNHIKSINSFVNNGQLKSLYLCVNDVDMSSRSYSYRRYGYGYGSKVYGSYGYGDHEIKKKKKKGFFSFLSKN